MNSTMLIHLVTCSLGEGGLTIIAIMNPIKISPKQKRHIVRRCVFSICFETAVLINYNDANFIQSAFSS